jgi:hypothetical protein
LAQGASKVVAIRATHTPFSLFPSSATRGHARHTPPRRSSSSLYCQTFSKSTASSTAAREYTI